MAKPKVDKGIGLSKEDCYALGEQALASFTRDELHDYASQVFAKAKEYPNLSGQAAIKKAIEDINEEHVSILFDACKTTANNTIKFNARQEAVKAGIDIRQMLSSRGKNEANNLAQAQAAGRAKLVGAFYDGITKEQESFIYTKDNDMDIARALDGKQASPEAKEIANRTNRFMETRNNEMVRSDALPIQFISKFKFLEHMHDASAMLNNGRNLVERAKNLIRGLKDILPDPKGAWVSYIKERLDLEEMFKGSKARNIDGSINDAEVERILGNSFDNITQNRSFIFTRSLVANDREAIAKKMLMKFKFKDWQSFVEYNNKYGKGSFAAALNADIMASGSKIGVADLFGSSPYGTYMDLTKVQRDIGIPRKFEPNLWVRHNDFIFRNVMGADQQPVAPGLANLISNITALTSTVRLLKVGLLSTPDIGHATAYIGRFGHNEFSAWGYMFQNLFNNKLGQLANPDRALIAKKFKLIVDSHLGYIMRAIDAQSSSQLMNRISSGVFKVFQLENLDKGNKISILHLMAKTLGESSEKGWDDISPELRKQLANHNVSQSEWDLLRNKTENGLFTTDNVDNLTDEELRAHYQTTDKSIPLLNLKSELYRKVYSFFDVASQNVIMNPDAFSRAFVYYGTTPGTVLGELTKLVMQFKMYPVNYIDRAWRQGLNNADGIMPKMAFGMRMMAATLPLSYLSTMMGYLMQGKSMPNPSTMTPANRLKYYASIALPGMGVFSGLMDSKNQNKDLLWSTLRSPSLNLINESMAALLTTATGGFSSSARKQMKKEFSDIAKSTLPIDTIPFLSPYLRESLGEKPFLESGQKQYYGA